MCYNQLKQKEKSVRIMADRRASKVLFGFDFQINAAIVLMLENINDLEFLRLESDLEDIDLTLSNGQHILAQAKAVVNGSTDFQNVRRNLQKALTSLSEACQSADAKQLILITNSLNPFKDEASRQLIWGPTRRNFSTLPPSAQTIITEYLANIPNSLDTDKFTVQVLPFETDDDDERYKAVMQAIDNFIGGLRLNIPGLGKRLLDTWHWEIFTNGTKSDSAIRLNKKSIIWPIMVIATDVENCDDDFLNQFDPAEYEEIVHHYKETIDNCCERIEFFTRVLYDFSTFDPSKKGVERILAFVEQTWANYQNEFAIPGIDAQTQEGLAKIVLYSIVRRRYTIEKIKRGVNL